MASNTSYQHIKLKQYSKIKIARWETSHRFVPFLLIPFCSHSLSCSGTSCSRSQFWLATQHYLDPASCCRNAAIGRHQNSRPYVPSANLSDCWKFLEPLTEALMALVHNRAAAKMHYELLTRNNPKTIVCSIWHPWPPHQKSCSTKMTAIYNCPWKYIHI